MPDLAANIEFRATNDPAGFEARALASAGQAMIVTVFVLALANFLLHPRRKLIEHAILSLYLHAALLPVIAIMLLLANLFQAWPVGIIATLVVSLLALGTLFWRADRGFYGSSWWGAALRLPVQLTAYLTAITAASLSLIVMQAL